MHQTVGNRSGLFSVAQGNTQQIYSQLNITFDGTRKASYTISNVILPLIFIMMFAYMTFWMAIDNDRRIYACFTALTGTLAFNIVVQLVLPQVSYMTLLSSFSLATYCFVVSVLCINMVIRVIESTCDEVERKGLELKKLKKERARNEKKMTSEYPRAILDAELKEMRRRHGPTNKWLYPLWWCFGNKAEEADICFCIKINKDNSQRWMIAIVWVNSLCRVTYLLALLVLIPSLLAPRDYNSPDY